MQSRSFHKLAIFGAIAASLVSAIKATPVAAADVPIKTPAAMPYSDWSGFYVGGHAGYGWAGNLDFTISDPNGSIPYAPAQITARGNNGAIGGVQLGYNRQLNSRLVLGVEADWSWTKLSLAATTGLFFSPSATCRFR